MEDIVKPICTGNPSGCGRVSAAYDLNQPVGPSREVIVLPEVWDRCERGDDLPERDGSSACSALDIGGSSSA